MGAFWQELLKFLGGMAIASAALAWLAKQIIVHFLSKDVEAYKVRLKAESDKEIESLKSRLELLNQQQLIRFSSLHSKQIKFANDFHPRFRVAFTQAKLLRAIFNLNDFTRDGKHVDDIEAGVKLTHSIWPLEALLRTNKLIIDEKTAQTIARAIECLQKYSSIHETILMAHGIDDALKQKHINQWDNLKNELEASESALEAEFRKLIGSEEQ